MELLQQEAQEKKIKKKNQKTLSVAASSCSGLGLTLNCILMVKKKKSTEWQLCESSYSRTLVWQFNSPTLVWQFNSHCKVPSLGVAGLFKH